MPQRETQQVKKQHPVPQNIMSVEFKLIGDMTVRQFFYVSCGAVLSFIFLKADFGFLVRWAGILFFGLGGVALAFVPVQERGLDVWFKSFFKSMFTPTQKIWHKNPNVPLFFLSDYAQSLKTDVLVLTPTKSRLKLYKYLEKARILRGMDPLEKAENEFLQKLDFSTELPKPLVQEAHKAVKATINSTRQEGKKEKVVFKSKIDRPLRNIKLHSEITLPKEAVDIYNEQNKENILIERAENKEINPKKIKELRDTINLAKKELEKKRKEGTKTKFKLNIESKKTDTATLGNIIEIKKGSSIKNGAEKKTDTPISSIGGVEKLKKSEAGEGRKNKITIVEAGDIKGTKKPQTGIGSKKEGNPNIVSGTVLDEDGHTIEGSLLLIKDGNGNPERALKTNRLGKFSITTPVENGKYTIETRYQNKKFDVVNFIAEGRPIKPITIKAKY